MVRVHNGEMRVGPVSEAGLTSKASSGGEKEKEKKEEKRQGARSMFKV